MCEGVQGSLWRCVEVEGVKVCRGLCGGVWRWRVCKCVKEGRGH